MLNESLTDALDIAPQWHADQPDILARAMRHAVTAAPHLSRLARLVLPRMPTHLRAASTLKTDAATTRIMPLHEAITHEHIAIRDARFARAIAVDIDNDGWSGRLAELARFGLPAPTWLTANAWTARAHAVWVLHDAVLLGDRGHAAPQRLLAVVQSLLTEALDGDRAYSGLMTRNPWRIGRPITKGASPALPGLWDAYQASGTQLQHAVIPAPELHTLDRLRRALLAWQAATDTLTPMRRRAADLADCERGARLFNAVRQRVYGDWPCDVAAIVAQEAARLGSPINPRQAAAMARNITRWMTRRWAGRRTTADKHINRGRDRLATSGLELAERQAVSGRRTAEARSRNTDARLKDAVARLQAAGRPVTQAAIGAEAGVSERTVRRWQQPDKRCASVKRLAGPALAPA